MKENEWRYFVCRSLIAILRYLIDPSVKNRQELDGLLEDVDISKEEAMK